MMFDLWAEQRGSGRVLRAMMSLVIRCVVMRYVVALASLEGLSPQCQERRNELSRCHKSAFKQEYLCIRWQGFLWLFPCGTAEAACEECIGRRVPGGWSHTLVPTLSSSSDPWSLSALLPGIVSFLYNPKAPNTGMSLRDITGGRTVPILLTAGGPASRTCPTRNGFPINNC